MRIGFYAPFKPLDHPNPSGDQMIGRGLVESLEQQGHEVKIVSSLRCRWIYWDPLRLLAAKKEIQRLIRVLQKEPVDCWLTYHCYYKSPDLLGPVVSRRLSLPYIIVQGSYGTKFKRQLKSKPGFYLSRKALLRANLHISDRQQDLTNLKRIIPEKRLYAIKPGIVPKQFRFDAQARRKLRKEWGIQEEPVICSAAMLRPDVKSEGIEWLLRCCFHLYNENLPFKLLIAGDGTEKTRLQSLADKLLPERVFFIGKVPREQMYSFYSCGDVFAFPGFNESLGMVYLEAQSSGLPVIACDNGGIPEVVVDKQSGFLVPLYDQHGFSEKLKLLLTNPSLCQTMGRFAANHIRQNHDRDHNYQHIGTMVQTLVNRYQNRNKTIK